MLITLDSYLMFGRMKLCPRCLSCMAPGGLGLMVTLEVDNFMRYINLLTYLLTFAVRLFTMANGVGSVQKE